MNWEQLKDKGQTMGDTVPYKEHRYATEVYCAGGSARDSFKLLFERVKPARLNTVLPVKWRVKVGECFYSEKWLRAYVAYRDVHYCTALASLYADEQTGKELPLVVSRELDYKILSAYARMNQDALRRKPAKALVPAEKERLCDVAL